MRIEGRVSKTVMVVCIGAWLLVVTNRVRHVVLGALTESLVNIGVVVGCVVASLFTGVLVKCGARAVRHMVVRRRTARVDGVKVRRRAAAAVRSVLGVPALMAQGQLRLTSRTTARRGSEAMVEDEGRSSSAQTEDDVFGAGMRPSRHPAQVIAASTVRAHEEVPTRVEEEGTSAPLPTVLVIGCRAVQIGDHNWQFLHFRCELEAQLDFTPVLRRSDVQQALEELALDPENSELRDRVMSQLCRRWEFFGSKALELRRVERVKGPAGARITPGERVLDSLCEPDTGSIVVVRDCEGVQIGDHSRQTAEFAYVCKRPKLSETTLLRENPAVAGALVDIMIGRAEPGPGDALHREVELALRSYGVHFTEPGKVIQGPNTTIVTGAEGMAFGRENHVVRSEEVHPLPRMPSIAAERARIGRRVVRVEMDRLDDDASVATTSDAPHLDGAADLNAMGSPVADAGDGLSSPGLGGGWF
ncbi:RIP homotypic interaction motif-containing protein [Streptomyces sp. NPDC002588]|uniref:RIP homotypic interaction motif-containing protein n=1 Tax=Streptomyces sp. NPDC002588 TaxID=3154419 RepID=UPI003316A443